MAGAVLDEAGVGVADGIELVVGKRLVQRGEGVAVLLFVVEGDALVAIFLEVAFAAGEGEGGNEGEEGQESQEGGRRAAAELGEKRDRSMSTYSIEFGANACDGIIGWWNRKA